MQFAAPPSEPLHKGASLAEIRESAFAGAIPQLEHGFSAIEQFIEVMHPERAEDKEPWKSSEVPGTL